MIIVLGIILVLFVVWPQFRNVISGYISGIGYWLATLWTNYRAVLIISLLVIWLLPVAVLLFIGWYTNSMVSAMIFLFIFPFWIISLIRSGLASLRSLTSATPGAIVAPARAGFLRSVLALILVFAAINILIGIWSPELKDALNTWTFFKKKDLAVSVHKSTSKMESIVGTQALVTEDGTATFNASNKLLAYLNKGDEVFVPDIKNIEKAGPNSEGYIWVMIKNNHRQFLNGKAGKLPIRLIEYKSDLPAPILTPAPVPPPLPPAEKKPEEKTSAEKSWEYGFDHPKDGQPRKFPVKSFQRDECSMRIETEMFVLNGTSSDGIIYAGSWFQGGERRGELRNFHFSTTTFCWEGETNQINPATENWKRITLCQK